MLTRSRRYTIDQVKEEAAAATTPNDAKENGKRKQKAKKQTDGKRADEMVNVTPPKQGKFIRNPDSQYSPSMLLDRMSLNATGASSNEENEPVEVKPSKPKTKMESARKVLNIGETESLYGREKELQELTQFLEERIRDSTSASMYVSGTPGTGKTACVRKLLKSPMVKGNFKTIYINCTSIQTPTAIFKAIAAQMGLKSEKDHRTSIEKYLCGHSRKQCLLVLDEIDELIEKKQSVLYTIFEWPALPKSNVALIGIANSLDLTNRALIRLQVNAELKPQLIHFAPYTKQQIIDIFLGRLKEANILEVFPIATIHLLSAKVAALSGDVRKALDIGRRVVELVKTRSGTNLSLDELGIGPLDVDSGEQKVEMKQVLSLLNTVYSTANTLQSDDSMNDFPLQQKMFVCTLLLMLRNGKNKDITVGRLHNVYAKVCTKRGITAIDQTEFIGICSLIETKGIVRVIKNKVSRLTKILLQWDEDEITEAIKDKQLIAAILADTSCMDK